MMASIFSPLRNSRRRVSSEEGIRKDRPETPRQIGPVVVAERFEPVLDVVCEPREPPEQKSHTARDRKRKPGNPPTPRRQPEARRGGAAQRLDGAPEAQAGRDAESQSDTRLRLFVVKSGKRENGYAGHENRPVEGREDRRLEVRKGRHREEDSRDQRDGRRGGPCREQPDEVHRQDSLEHRSNGYGDSRGPEERDEGRVQITFEGTEASSR